MDEEDHEYKIDFLEQDENVLAVLFFDSAAKGELNSRSDRDFCAVAPEIRDRAGMRSLLKKIYVCEPLVGKRYDVWLFEELPLYMKLQSYREPQSSILQGFTHAL